MDWPQGVMALLLSVQVLMAGASFMDGGMREALPPSAQVLLAGVVALLLHVGGFW